MGKYKWGGILLFVAMLLTFFAVISKEEPLPEYTEIPVEVNEQVAYATQLYQTDTFVIEVPTDWTSFNANGVCSFVDTQTSSTIELSYASYTPSINMLNADTVENNLVGSGYDFVNFVRRTNCSYNATYVKGDIAYTEYVYWDLSTIYTIVGKYKTTYYEKVFDLISYCAESFSWSGPKIPDGFRVNYYIFGNFSITVKDSWGIAESSDTLTISDPDYGTNIRVSVCQTADDFSEITQLMLTQSSAVGKYDYLQSSFNNTGALMTSAATYTVNGNSMEEYQYYIATGEYQYRIIIEMYAGNTDAASAQTFIDNFRYY